MSHYRPWTPEEDAAIATDENRRALAEKLGRSDKAIGTRRTLLRRRGTIPHLARPYNPWSEDDSKLIEMFDAGKSDAEIGAELHRTPKVIRVRRCHLGLRRQVDAPSHPEVNSLRIQMTISPWQELSDGTRIRTLEAAR